MERKNKGLFNIFELQKKSLLKEIEKAGMSLINYEEKFSEDENNKSFVESVIFGRLKADYWQIYELSYKGRKHVYVQPYSNYFILPGEHHTFLSGTLTDPIILNHKPLMKGSLWFSENMDYAKQLNNEKYLRSIVNKIRMTWFLGFTIVNNRVLNSVFGFTFVINGWTVQAYNIDQTRTKLGMKSGGYGGFITHRVGFKVFNEIVDFFDGRMNLSGEAQRPIKSMSYDIPANSFLGLPSNEVLNKEWLNADYVGIIRKAVTPYLGKNVFLHDLPEKKAELFRKHVMSESRSHDPIVAAIDNKGSKEGIVFTPGHCFIKLKAVKIAFEIGDILDFREAEVYEGNHMKLILTNGFINLPIKFQDDSSKIFCEIVKQRCQPN